MIVRLKVFEQTLTVLDTNSVPRTGSKDYLILQFSFSSDWNDLSKLCYLQKDEISQPIDIVDGLAEVPEWFTQQESFDVTLFGKAGDKEVPTNVVSMRLEKSNTLWENDAPEPQPSWIGKIIDLNNHPPVPGDNGFWLIWDTDNGTYAESNLPLPPASGGGTNGTWDQISGKPFNTIDENTLVNRSGTLYVNTTDNAEKDNTRPITSSGVNAICGNINALLQEI